MCLRVSDCAWVIACVRDKRGRRMKTDSETTVAAFQDTQLSFFFTENVFNIRNCKLHHVYEFDLQPQNLVRAFIRANYKFHYSTLHYIVKQQQKATLHKFHAAWNIVSIITANTDSKIVLLEWYTPWMKMRWNNFIMIHSFILCCYLMETTWNFLLKFPLIELLRFRLTELKTEYVKHLVCVHRDKIMQVSTNYNAVASLESTE